MDATIKEIVRKELRKLAPAPSKGSCGAKKRVETSKALAWATFGLVAFCVVMCFVFAAIENIDLPEHVYSVVKVVLGIYSIVVGGYFTKSYGEKASRNKNKLDADGNPIVWETYGGGQETQALTERAAENDN